MDQKMNSFLLLINAAKSLIRRIYSVGLTSLLLTVSTLRYLKVLTDP